MKPKQMEGTLTPKVLSNSHIWFHLITEKLGHLLIKLFQKNDFHFFVDRSNTKVKLEKTDSGLLTRRRSSAGRRTTRAATPWSSTTSRSTTQNGAWTQSHSNTPPKTSSQIGVIWCVSSKTQLGLTFSPKLCWTQSSNWSPSHVCKKCKIKVI